MVNYTQCPVCSGTTVAPYLTVTDFSVSGKPFDVWRCPQCTACFTQNIPSADEIGPYYQFEDYISHTDTQKGFINQLYHRVRRFTLNGKRKLVQKSTARQTGNLLDVGCGTGAFLNTMHKAGWTVTGLEPDAHAREKCRALYNLEPQPSENIFSLAENQFDAITLWHVLEHVHDLPGYMRRLRKLLKPGGKLIIAVPNYTSRDAQTYKAYWAAWDVPRHLYHFSPAAMETLLPLYGFTLRKLKPMWFDSFYVCMLSEKYRKGNLLRAGFNAWFSNLIALFNRKRCSSVIYIAD